MTFSMTCTRVEGPTEQTSPPTPVSYTFKDGSGAEFTCQASPLTWVLNQACELTLSE